MEGIRLAIAERTEPKRSDIDTAGSKLVDGYKPDEDRIVHLTKREMEVVSLILEGKTSKETADALYVSKRTIDFHLARIYDKLQVSNRVQLFKRAVRLGFIDPTEP